MTGQETAKPGSSVQRGLAAIKYLHDRPGQVIHYTEVAQGIGAEPCEPDIGRVNSVLARAVRQFPERGICREGRGHYVYRPDLDSHPARPGQTPAGPKPGDLFEVVGQVGGDVVVRDPVTYELLRLERWT